MKNLLTTVIVILLIIILVYIDATHRAQKSPLVYPDPLRTTGASDAPVKIVAFNDFSAVDAALGYVLISEYAKEFPDQIRVTVKYFPTVEDLRSMVSTFYAYCAAQQGQFFPYQDKLFTNRWDWTKAESPDEKLLSLAKDLSLDIGQFENCVHGKATKVAIESERAIGESHFVHMGPTYFIDGKMFIGSAELNKYLSRYFNVPEKNISIENFPQAN